MRSKSIPFFWSVRPLFLISGAIAVFGSRPHLANALAARKTLETNGIDQEPHTVQAGVGCLLTTRILARLNQLCRPAAISTIFCSNFYLHLS